MLKHFVLSLVIVGTLVSATPAFAAYNFSENSGLNTTAQKTGYDTTETNGQDLLMQSTGNIINIILSFVGVLFLGLTMYGGYRWMMAGGNTSDVELAKKIITRALIGLVVVLAAYAITNFVSSNVTGDLIQK